MQCAPARTRSIRPPFARVCHPIFYRRKKIVIDEFHPVQIIGEIRLWDSRVNGLELLKRNHQKWEIEAVSTACLLEVLKTSFEYTECL